MKPVAKTFMDRPSDAAILERAASLANEAMHTIALQRRRVRSKEPEDRTFLFRKWVDLQFLIVALRRLRRTAELASNVPSVGEEIIAALDKFDKALPSLKVMRNVGEHIDKYALDSPERHHRRIHRRSLQVGCWDGTTYEWLGFKLNIDTSHKAALNLYQVVRRALKNYPIPKKQQVRRTT